ncbi:hypothetical protein DH2020_043223 [Rehmannia glutinosa]|uniref:HXXXD-type acyl-transferase family protein n=1 Tax=Rehmannia glutinosa TaxID=99300 RepID=A0ABR0ULF5_REHGL
MTKIEVISSCTLVGTANESHPVAKSRLELTPWDLLFLQIDPIQKGLLFHKPNESQEFQKNIIDHLINSFSRTLGFFPPLAAAWAPLRTTAITRRVSSSTATMPELSSLTLLLAPCLFPTSWKQSCSANHVVVDGACFWHFFNSWSEISCGFDKISKSPVFERRFDNGAIRFPTLEQNHLQNSVPSPLLRRVFHFCKESVAKLKAKANSKLANIRNNLSSQEACIYLLVDARARISLPEGYFGNAVYVASTETSETKVLQNGLGYAGIKINELVAQQTSEAAIKYVEDWVKNPTILRKGGIAFVISSSPRHNIYGNDFGWGKPIAVRCGKVQKFDGNMMVHPAAVSGGIDVEVCLAPETLKAMEGDVEFMEAVTI